MRNLVTFTLLLATSGLMLGCAQEGDSPAAEAVDAAQSAAADAGTAAQAAATDAAGSVNTLLASGNAEAGKRIYIYCQSCHSINEGGANKVGPNLYDIVGKPAAQVEGFVYSDALAGSGVEWTPQALDQWIARPAQMVPGTTMLFAGVNDMQQRADLIAYLQQNGAQ